jgi:uncharacterized protein YcgL (UPF0745 family)
MSYELAQKYADFKIPSEFKRGYGSPNFIKTMLFANEVQLTNDDIDYYMSIPPQRQEDESYDDMKQRNKLANAMLKYRSKLYDYSVYEKIN